MRNPEQYEIGLLLLLLKDLWTSDLPVGGESSIGRGRLQGLKAEILRYKSNSPHRWTISQKDEALQVRDETDTSKSEKLVQEELEGYVKALLKHLGKDI